MGSFGRFMSKLSLENTIILFLIFSRLASTGPLAQGAAMDSKKSLRQIGIDPTPLAFKASPLTRFRGKW
jgi:hypothetical protein